MRRLALRDLAVGLGQGENGQVAEVSPTILDASSLSTVPDLNQSWWSDPEERLADMEAYYSIFRLEGGGSPNTPD